MTMTMTKPKKPRIVGRTDIGIAVYGGTTYPLGAHLIYRLDWSDGTSTIDRGLTVGTMPGKPTAFDRISNHTCSPSARSSGRSARRAGRSTPRLSRRGRRRSRSWRLATAAPAAAMFTAAVGRW
jgi:hypothetical protein